MEIVLHRPEGRAGREAQARRTARAHAWGVLRAVGGLDCPAEQKRELLRLVERLYQEGEE